MADLVAASPWGMIDPGEVAAVVEFLVPPEGAAVNGAEVLVDGDAVASITG